jgi:hypothetical protein
LLHYIHDSGIRNYYITSMIQGLEIVTLHP